MKACSQEKSLIMQSVKMMNVSLGDDPNSELLPLQLVARNWTCMLNWLLWEMSMVEDGKSCNFILEEDDYVSYW